jgi:tRNA threonylcarbamoyladenosine biosynthesis protein TsaB
MKGLLLDTSTKEGLIGLAQDGELLVEHRFEGGKNLTALLFPLLEKICPIQEITYIAVGIGPGSYIGMRTAATIAKSLAYARNLPLLPFYSPFAFLPNGLEGKFAFIGDAKLSQYFLLEGQVQIGKPIERPAKPQLIDLKQFNPDSYDFVVGPDHHFPEPNLKWVAQFASSPYIKEETPIELAYLR